MSCHHATTTTVAWSYGELDGDADAHGLHIATCDDCLAAVEDLEAAEAAVAPLAGALGVLPTSSTPEPHGAPAEAPSRWRPALARRLLAAVALAAAVGLGTLAALLDDRFDDHVDSVPVASHAPAPAPSRPAPTQAPDLDRALEDLELELDMLRTDPSIL